MLQPKVPIAKEGYPFIFIAAFLTLIFAILNMQVLAFLSVISTLFIIYFFRDPERFVPDIPNAIISPADGKIIVIEQLDQDSFTQGPSCKVSIFMNVFNVHVNRAPLSGSVEKIIYEPGKFYSADSDRGAMHNEYCATLLTTETGKTIGSVQIAGLIARRIINWLEPGDSVHVGQRFGLIRFGSRVDLYLPQSSVLNVKLGQKVRAGETVIATLD